MKRKTVIDLIKAYYEDDANLFFNSTLDVIREFKEDGQKELYEYLMNILKGRVKVRPKIEKNSKCDMEISFEEGEELGFTSDFVPQSTKEN